MPTSSASNPAPILHQPFVVGPGFSPIPAKIVTQIVSGKFVEFDELLSTNIVLTEPEPQLLFNGRLVLTSGPKKFKRRIEDIATWMEAFSTFMLVLSSYFPHHWKDLCQYQLLILQTHCQFASCVCLSYDRAFRQHAAATNLVDWSSINVQLFNFHTVGPSVHGGTTCPLAPWSLAVLALRESCLGRGTGDSAPHLVWLAGLSIVVPAVPGLTVPHPALVSRLTSPRLIPSGGHPPPSPGELIANREECDGCLVLGHASHLSFHCVLLPSVHDFSSFVRRTLPTGLCILSWQQTYLFQCAICFTLWQLR